MAEGMLSDYRILDLTDEKGIMGGRVLGDLGADVIQIEKPCGNTARNIGPFYKDDPDPEKSLFWFSCSANKRGITLDIDTADGKEIFKKLVKTADAVIESFPPGYMEENGLGISELEKINPGISLVSITPFGQTGPYRDYKISDIIAWAMGGYMFTLGDEDRPPVRISYHDHAYLQAGIQAAQGALMAIYHREMTGEAGQYIDVSIQDAVTRVTPERITHHWDFSQRIGRRGGRMGLVSIRRIWPCIDGYVYAIYWGGQFARRWNSPLVRWMEAEGVATDFISNFDWDTFEAMQMTQDVADGIEGPTLKLFEKFTKNELLNGALEHNVQLYPLSDNKDFLDNIQLKSRDFWVDVEHEDLGDTLKYPGGFAKITGGGIPPNIHRRAPLIGEHNEEIYVGELGISNDTLIALKQAKVI
ncbi:CaiB/BaiF CoA transferase family protein [Chloroflexota bacterium]